MPFVRALLFFCSVFAMPAGAQQQLDITSDGILNCKLLLAELEGLRTRHPYLRSLDDPFPQLSDSTDLDEGTRIRWESLLADDGNGNQSSIVCNFFVSKFVTKRFRGRPSQSLVLSTRDEPQPSSRDNFLMIYLTMNGAIVGSKGDPDSTSPRFNLEFNLNNATGSVSSLEKPISVRNFSSSIKYDGQSSRPTTDQFNVHRLSDFSEDLQLASAPFFQRYNLNENVMMLCDRITCGGYNSRLESSEQNQYLFQNFENITNIDTDNSAAPAPVQSPITEVVVDLVESIVEPVATDPVETPNSSTHTALSELANYQRGTIQIARVHAEPGEEEVTEVDIDSELGGLPCVMDALGVDVDISEDVCNGDLLNVIRSRGALLRFDSNGDWIVVPIPKNKLEELRVLIPNWAEASQCTLRARYLTQTGSPADLIFSPSQENDVEFVARLEEPAEVSELYLAEFDIEPQDANACGAVKTTVQVDTRVPSQVVKLFEGKDESTYMVFAFLTRDEDLKEVGITNNGERTGLGNALFLALRSALRQHQHFEGNKPWWLTGASVVTLDGVKGEALVSLSANQLRSKDLGALTIGSADLAPIKETRSVASWQNIFTAGASGVEKIGSSRKLTYVVAGYGRPTAEGGKPDFCSAENLEPVMDAFARAGLNANVEILAFPLFRQNSSSQIALNDFMVERVNPSLADLPSEMLECRNTPENIRIFPYFAADWRLPDEISARYGSAVADRLGILLKSTVIR